MIAHVPINAGYLRDQKLIDWETIGFAPAERDLMDGRRGSGQGRAPTTPGRAAGQRKESSYLSGARS